MRLWKLLPAAALLTAASAPADVFGCANTAERRITAPSAGLTRIVIIGRAGSLRVTGRSGASEAVATGTACSSDKGALNEIKLEARRDGGELRIEAVIPEKTMIFDWYEARLDFEVTVPAGIPIRVKDGSGWTKIEGTGPLEVVDGSGELEIRRVQGEVKVDDGSGSIEIAEVTGSVSVNDGSGSIEVRGVQRDVTIRDGSGSIDVQDVGGEFVVESDGSGGVSYERVAGRVSVPSRR